LIVAFPDDLPKITVTGTIVTNLTGVARTARFTCPYWVLDPAADRAVSDFVVQAVADGDGAFSVDLPAGRTYDVRLQAGASKLDGILAVPASGGPIDVADALNPDGQAEPGVTYLLAAARSAAGGVAGLDVDGDVIDADGNKITGGGGGGEGTPSSTVVSETAYAQTANAGNATAYSRGNHTHGTPALPTAAAIGAATTGALTAHEADTTAVHGIADTTALVLTGDSRLSNARTPTAHASSHTDGGADEISIDGSQVTSGTVAIARLPTGTGGSQVALGNHSHGGGGGGTITIASNRVTTGDLTTTNDASFTVVPGFAPSIAAVAGDRVEFVVSGLLDMAAGLTEYFELCTLVSGAAVRYSSSGAGTPSTEGDPALYPAARFRGSEVSFFLTAQSGDISGGNIAFGFAHKGAGAAKVLASTTYPLRWRIINYGQ
jgi:hypothetical protein